MKIIDLAFRWKMRFNPDPKKQAQEVIFSRKINKIDHPPLYFNENLVKSSSAQKHLGMILDTKLDFSLHLKNVQNKVNKTIGLLRKHQYALPRTSLITYFKSFIRPRFVYGDIFMIKHITLRFIKISNQFNTKTALAMLLDILLRKFDTSSQKEMKMMKTQIL